MRLLLTRPEADAARSRAALMARGHEVVTAPLLTIVPSRATAIDLSGVQALLITSRNGLSAFAALSPRRDLPVYAVGPASAEAARAAGFAEVVSAEGDAAALVALVADRLRPEAGLLYHPAGRHVAGELSENLAAAGFTLRRVRLYQAEAAKFLPDNARTALAKQGLDGVLFYSPRTVRTFVRLVEGTELATACERLTAFCLSPAVAEEARRLTWSDVSVASAPNEAALLSLLDGGA
jgi:uroporphyrinogen-III synthase